MGNRRSRPKPAVEFPSPKRTVAAGVIEGATRSGGSPWSRQALF